MIIKCIWILTFIVGMAIGAAATLGGIKFYWAIVGGILVAISMLTRYFSLIERE